MRLESGSVRHSNPEKCFLFDYFLSWQNTRQRKEKKVIKFIFPNYLHVM